MAVLPQIQIGDVYQLKVTLKDIEPPIWRRLLVPGEIRLRGLHQVLQVVMGWQDAHLYQFQVGQRYFEPPEPASGASGFTDSEDDAKVRLATIAPRTEARLLYTYDMGDTWEHDIVVEKILSAQPDVHRPVCVDGGRACPPEDCGGAWGYANILAALEDPSREGADELLNWLDAGFDPEAWDLDTVNGQLAKLRTGAGGRARRR